LYGDAGTPIPDASGNVIVRGDLYVLSGNILTTATTGNIFPTNATTINLGTAATSMSIGANTGTTTINNDLVVDGTGTFAGDITATGADFGNITIAVVDDNTISTTTGALVLDSATNIVNVNARITTTEIQGATAGAYPAAGLNLYSNDLVQSVQLDDTDIQLTVNGRGWILNADGTTQFPDYKFPYLDGTANQVLITDGLGSLSFADVQSLDTNYTIDASATTGGANFNLQGSDSTTDTIKLADGGHITATATSASIITLGSDATDANTASTIVARDASGEFSAGGALLGAVQIGVASDQSITTTAGDLQLDSFTGAVSFDNATLTTGSGNVFLFNDATVNQVDAFLGAETIQIGNTTGSTTVRNTLAATNMQATNIQATTASGLNLYNADASNAIHIYDNYIQLVSGTIPGADWVFNEDGTTDFPSYKFPYADGTANQILVTDGSGILSFTSNPIFAGGTFGNITVGVADDNTITTTTGNLNLTAIAPSFVNISSETNAPTLITRNSTATSSSVRSLALAVQSSGTPTVGFGNNLEWQLETAPGNTESAGYISVVSTDLTATSENFKMSFGLMQNGAAYSEKAFIDSTGNMTLDGDLTVNDAVVFNGSTSGSVTIAAPATAGSQSYTLPTALPAVTGYVLSGTTGGALSWVDNATGVTSITGTANQVIASSPTGAVTLSLPQSIATTSTPTFAGATLDAVTIGVDTSNTISTTAGNLTLQTAAGVNSGQIIMTAGTNGDIFLAPNGTGKVQINSTADINTLEVTNIRALDGTAAATIANSTGVITISTQLNVDNINISGNSIISTDTNGAITLAPNGTGDVILSTDVVQVGDANDTATITTNGTGNLVLNTNNGTNAGTLTLTNGVFASTGSSISATTLTIGTLSSGVIAVGQTITGGTTASGTVITANLSGTGSGSTWTVSISQTVASSAITGAGNITLAPVNAGSVVNTFSNGGNITNNRNYVFGAIRNATIQNTNGDIWALNTSAPVGGFNPYFRGVSLDNSADTTRGPATLMRSYSGGASPGSASRGRVIFEKARGTAASPTAVQLGDILGSVDVTGYTSTGWLNDTIPAVTGFFGFAAQENWVSNTALGTNFSLSLAPTTTTISTGANLVQTLSINPQTFASRSDAFTWANGKTGTTQTMALDVSGNLTVTGDVRINGNDIRNSDNISQITMSAAGATLELRGDNIQLENAGGSALPSGKVTYGRQYIEAYSTQDQTNPVANAENLMSFNNTGISNGISIVTNGTTLTRITMANAGLYNIQFSAQLNQTSGGAHNAFIWLKKNGANVANSAGDSRVAGNGERIMAAWNYVVDAAAGDYYELAWASDGLDVLLDYVAASAPIPAVPSVILTVVPVGA
jgi:hypothetical protein